MFALQMLSAKSDVAEYREVRAAAGGFKKEAAVVVACIRATAWRVPPGLEATQEVLEHISYLLCRLNEKCELYKGGSFTSLPVRFLV